MYMVKANLLQTESKLNGVNDNIFLFMDMNKNNKTNTNRNTDRQRWAVC
jgi:hypothetical protein